MKTIVRIFLFSLGAASLWSAGADAQTSALGRCGLASPRGLLGLAPGGAAAHAAMARQTFKCLQGTEQAPAAGPHGAGGQFVTFDPPGSTSTTPVGITPDGTIAGYYCDDTAACAAQAGIGPGAHGFLRDRNGNFTTFDPPGSTSTFVGSISTNGEIAGAWCETSLFTCARVHGFVRAKNGTFTTFDSPESSGGILPGYFCCGAPPSINPAGTVAGMLYGFVPSYHQHGFIRDKNGVLTTIDAPGATGITQVFDINPSGSVIGETTASYTGFIRFPNGNFTTINTPGSVACGGGSSPSGINPAGAVTGSSSDATCSFQVGYLWTPDGTVTTFTAPGFSSANATAINPAGLITGLAYDLVFPFQGYYGFLRSPDGAITTFAAPGAIWTWPTGISNGGAVIGFTLDANFVSHGFLRLP